jgi:hypothetical protein
MFSFKKMAASLLASAAILSLGGINASADDYVFDVSKASRTFGKGTSYTHYTRLDNENMDKNNFNPLWITTDSSIIIEFESSGDYEEAPLTMTFQSWTGEKVTGTEDKSILVYPSIFTDTTATITYDDMVEWYGTDDFSDVYCISVNDCGNQILVDSITVTNCNIPEDQAENAKGTIIKEGEAAEVETVETPEETTVESVEEASAPDEEGEDTEIKDDDKEEPEEAANESSEDEDTEESSSNSMLIIIIAAAAVVVIAVVVVVIIVSSKNKKKSKHRFH